MVNIRSNAPRPAPSQVAKRRQGSTTGPKLTALLGLLLAPAACGRGPIWLFEPDPCEDAEACTSTSTLQRAVDILFVIDNSGSMGTEQGVLAANFPAFLEVLERQKVGASYRIGITTTDGRGNLRVSSCRERLDEFVFFNGDDSFIDATYDGCLASCTYPTVSTTPVGNDDDGEPSGRPWIEKTGARTNLEGDVSMGEALRCAGPQGINGSGFEMPLESMLAVLREEGNSAGFLRDEALLAVIFVTDETDCSASDNNIELLISDAGRALWSDQAFDARPTSAVCWNAGTTCEGGPGVYDSCFAVDKAFTGLPTESDDAVLHPVERYIDGLRATSLAKAERGGTSQVLVAVIGGVPVDYPAVGQMLFQDSDDPEFNLEYGIGPGCGRGTEDVHNPPGIPPVRAAQFAEAFATSGRNLYSICSPDYTPALEQIVDSLAQLSGRTCVPGCVTDGNPNTPGLQPNCRVVQRSASGAERDVPACVGLPDGWAFPSTSLDLCYRALTDGTGATAFEFDDMSQQCITQGWNLEVVVERPPDGTLPEGEQVNVICDLAYPAGTTCEGPEG